MEIIENMFKQLVHALELNEIAENGIYLARFRFNSKKITWQPVRVLSTQPEDDGFHCVRVHFMAQDREATVPVAMINGKFLCVDGGGDPSLKKIDHTWLRREWNKAQDELERAEKQVDFLDSLALQVDNLEE